jgi:hypothetical protein
MSNKSPSNTELDIRVRDRNLKSGLIAQKDVEKHISGLTDMEGQIDSFQTPQPALDAPELPDDIDDEDDEDGEGGDAQ